MTADPARSPLFHRRAQLASLAQTTNGEVVLSEVPSLAQVDLRMHPDMAAGLPFPIPLEPNTTAEGGGRTVLWLGPDEWLVLGPPGAAAGIVAELEGALGGRHRSIVDVSANRVALELGGPRAKEVLSKGCSLDLHPRVWKPGRCAQTLLARAQVILLERAEATSILVRPSFADYLVDWLLDASSEYTRG